MGVFLFGIRQRPTLPDRLQPSTIGAERLNFCVRYGNRWDPFAIVTGILSDTLRTLKTAHPDFFSPCEKPISFQFSLWSHLILRSSLDQVLDRLVSPSFIRYRTFTDDLSPGSLPGVLLLSNGILILEVGFTLRCLQRLSLPDLATLPWDGFPTDTPAVCPFRSSRTKNSSSQISYAHDG